MILTYVQCRSRSERDKIEWLGGFCMGKKLIAVVCFASLVPAPVWAKRGSTYRGSSQTYNPGYTQEELEELQRDEAERAKEKARLQKNLGAQPSYDRDDYNHYNYYDQKTIKQRIQEKKNEKKTKDLIKSQLSGYQQKDQSSEKDSGDDGQ